MRIIAQGHVWSDEGGDHRAFTADGEIGYVARMGAFGVLQTMMFGVGIKVPASGFEVRAFTLRGLMNMDAVVDRLQVVQVEFDANAVLGRRERGCPDALSLGVLQG